MKKNAKLLIMAVSKIDFLTDSFKFFVTQEWIFESEKCQSLIKELSPEEREIFNFDLT